MMRRDSKEEHQSRVAKVGEKCQMRLEKKLKKEKKVDPMKR
jgi:hypothetical protein